MDEWSQQPNSKNTGYRVIWVLLIFVVLVGGIFTVHKVDAAKRFFLTAWIADLTTRPSGDLDGDGLTNADEAQYHTYFWKKDTDCDGYTDGEEVDNGFQPRGAGKLSDDDIAITLEGEGC